MKTLTLFLTSILFFSACDPSGFQPVPTQEPPQAETETVLVYYNNTEQNPSAENCSAVFSVEREIEATNDTEEKLKLTLDELLNGPRSTELNNNYTSFFSEVTRNILDEVKIEDSIAYLDFDGYIKTAIPNATTSCGSAQFMASIEETATQFEEIDEVRYSIDGNPAEFYSWMQLSCPEDYEQCVINAG